LFIKLSKHSRTDNEAKAFAIFQEELDRCVDPLDREFMLINMGTEYRKIKKWDQSIEALHQLCISATRPDGTMLSQANEAMAQTYLEQYCTDTTLTIDQRTQILCHAQRYSFRVLHVSTEMHLTQAQLFYFNVTNTRPTIISSYTWMLDWPNASSLLVTLAGNGSDTDRFLSVARAAGSHHIVGGNTKR